MLCGCGSSAPVVETLHDASADPEVVACRGGDDDACHALLWTRPADEVPEDVAVMALEVLRTSCLDGGRAEACASFGGAITAGRGGDRWGDADAFEALDVGCSAGLGLACHGAAIVLRGEAGEAGDEALATTYFEQGCGAGEARSCLAAGDAMLDQQGARVGALDDALAAYTRGCQALSHGPSCRRLGQVHELGDPLGTLAPDVVAALEHYARGCELNDGSSCADGGLLALETAADDLDASKAALETMERGCVALADPYACSLTGQVLVLQFSEDATAVGAGRSMLELACEQRFADACTLLGQMHAVGLGNAEGPSPDRALLYLRQSCDDLQHAPACGMLAELLASDALGEPDLERARELAARACAAGDENGCRVLQRVESGEF